MKKSKLQINIEKKHVYFLAAIIVIIVGFSYAVAYGGTSPATMGHSAGEIDFNTDITVTGKVQATNFIGNGSQLTGISSSQWTTSGNNVYYNTGNVGIGTTNPGSKLEVDGGPIKAAGGLIIETRTDNPQNPETGRMWLITS